uniref:sterol 22-desaturase n=1 Tax=Phaffia rhodozyma TaxID=264483 RepID=K4MQB6_PHARH|nr:C22-sterol desaturase [Phaffia rhodozyma]AFV30199.1 C22-sterol desaturase [Phaffia rhodozyma]AFV30200.1 C22-sterol desaturase [Phaffia rhodozyma]AFV30201.1 C22-sterol desaturase [Phaffia rhodozyma]
MASQHVPAPSSAASAFPFSLSGTEAFTFPELTTRTLLGSILTVVASILIFEQINYRNKKQHLPGPTWTIPIIGKFLNSLHPTMEVYKAQFAQGELSAFSVFHLFLVMAVSNRVARKIFNSPDYAEPCLVASAKQVLLPENWVFLHGKVHAEYRRALNVLFTRKALSIYLPIQEKIYRRYFNEWMNDPDTEPKPYMMVMRDLNMETSLRVFCGEHMSEEEQFAISDKYWLITCALQLVNFPLALPGTKVYNAIKARKIAMTILEDVSAKSKRSMAEGNEPTCLIDAWMKEMIDAKAGKGESSAEERKALSREFSDHEIAMVVLSFLFASQDAMTSALVNTFELLADHPEILAKVREEQYYVRHNDVDAPLSFNQMDEMVYTRAMVKEALRLIPPVIFVPYLTLKPFPILSDYTVPKGTMLIPSLWPSCHDETIYPEPDSFVPERWLEKGGSAEANPKNYMVWGAGAHKCIGFEYAYMHLAACVGTASVTMDWHHKITPDTGKFQVIATLFPKDGLHLKFTPRPKPSF